MGRWRTLGLVNHLEASESLHPDSMPNRFRVSTAKIGLPPGAVVFTGAQKIDQVQVGSIRYGPSDPVTEASIELPDVAQLAPGASPVEWINVWGLHDTQLIQQLAGAFGVHPLAMEDIVSVGGRPSISDYDNIIFCSLKMLSLDTDGAVVSEHVSLITGSGWVLSFQERVGDVFDPLRERLRNATTRIRSRGHDYLWYALMDAVVDNYMIVLESMAERIDTLESLVWCDDPPADIPARVQRLREEVRVIRRAVRPLRDELDTFLRIRHGMIHETTVPFLSDLQDHLHQSFDTLEAMRETLSALTDAHLALVSMRTNEVMKVLTIMASVFIPLTFIAGIYGMNFEYMPELGVRWGYGAVWVVMIGSGLGMLAYFRTKRWL